MTVSPRARRALFARDTDEAMIGLVTITHPDLPAPIRFCNDKKDIVSNGETYKAYPFAITLPNDDPDQLPKVKLTIDAVKGDDEETDIVSILRGMQGSPDISFAAILASEPNVIQISAPNMKLKSVDIDISTIEGELGYQDFFSEPFPGGTMGPTNFRGLHK